jgi:hypothetical protein
MSKQEFLENLYVLKPSDMLTSPEGEFFHTIVAGHANYFHEGAEVIGTHATVIVQGGGIFVYVASVTNDAAADNYINPSTGEPFESKVIFDSADFGPGFYEKEHNQLTTLKFSPTMVINGNFTRVITSLALNSIYVYK